MEEKFICPENLFNGIVEKGTIYVKYNLNDSMYIPDNINPQHQYTLPAEIVTKWEKVQGNEIESINAKIKRQNMEIINLLAENTKIREEIKKQNEILNALKSCFICDNLNLNGGIKHSYIFESRDKIHYNIISNFIYSDLK